MNIRDAAIYMSLRDIGDVEKGCYFSFLNLFMVSPIKATIKNQQTAPVINENNPVGEGP